MYSDKYRCNEEIATLSERYNNYKGDNQEYKKQLKENIALRKLQKSCGVISKRLIDRVDNIEFYTCLCKIKHPQFATILSMVDAYEQGILPYDGGLMDQPAQAIELIQIAKHAKLIEQADKEKEKNGRQ